MLQTREIAIITGASSGIGKAFAHLFAKQNIDLILVARRKQRLEELKEELQQQYGVDVHVMSCDVSNLDEVKQLYETIQQKQLQVTYLINNAGLGGQGHFIQRQLEDELHMIQVNVMALTALTHLFAKEMVKQGKGRILNVSSIASLTPGPNQAVYFASKAFVTSLSYAVNHELRNTPVTLTTLLPGPVQTEFAKVASLEHTSLFKKGISPEKVAKIGYQAMQKGKRKAYAGVSLAMRVFYRMANLLPLRPILQITEQIQANPKQ